MGRFSPEFTALLKKRAGKGVRAFRRARREFKVWRDEQVSVEKISPFIARTSLAWSQDTADCGRDLSSEYYQVPNVYLDGPAPRLVLARRSIYVSDELVDAPAFPTTAVARRSIYVSDELVDAPAFPTTAEREIVSRINQRLSAMRPEDTPDWVERWNEQDRA